jgi:hypothetical protein
VFRTVFFIIRVANKPSQRGSRLLVAAAVVVLALDPDQSLKSGSLHVQTGYNMKTCWCPMVVFVLLGTLAAATDGNETTPATSAQLPVMDWQAFNAVVYGSVLRRASQRLHQSEVWRAGVQTKELGQSAKLKFPRGTERVQSVQVFVYGSFGQ